MELFGITDNMRNILEKSTEQWTLLLTSNGEDLEKVDTVAFLSMVHLLLILGKVKASYEWGKKKYKLNHLLFMNDLKLFSLRVKNKWIHL